MYIVYIVSPHPPLDLLGHDDQLRQGEAAVQVGLCSGQEEPREVCAELLGEVGRLQDNPPQSDMTDVTENIYNENKSSN